MVSPIINEFLTTLLILPIPLMILFEPSCSLLFSPDIKDAWLRMIWLLIPDNIELSEFMLSFDIPVTNVCSDSFTLFSLPLIKLLTPSWSLFLNPPIIFCFTLLISWSFPTINEFKLFSIVLVSPVANTWLFLLDLIFKPVIKLLVVLLLTSLLFPKIILLLLVVDLLLLPPINILLQLNISIFVP